MGKRSDGYPHKKVLAETKVTQCRKFGERDEVEVK